MKMTEEQELIVDLLIQGCGGMMERDGELVIDSMCLSSYEDACIYLAGKGILEPLDDKRRFYRFKKDDDDA